MKVRQINSAFNFAEYLNCLEEVCSVYEKGGWKGKSLFTSNFAIKISTFEQSNTMETFLRLKSLLA